MVSDIYSQVRKRLREFYARHNPKKMDFVDNLMEKYKGREEELFQRLHEKYNGFPTFQSEQHEPKATGEMEDPSASPRGYVPPLLQSQYDNGLREAIEDAKRAQEQRVQNRIAKLPGRMVLMAKMKREI